MKNIEQKQRPASQIQAGKVSGKRKADKNEEEVEKERAANQIQDGKVSDKSKSEQERRGDGGGSGGEGGGDGGSGRGQ